MPQQMLSDGPHDVWVDDSGEVTVLQIDLTTKLHLHIYRPTDPPVERIGDFSLFLHGTPLGMLSWHHNYRSPLPDQSRPAATVRPAGSRAGAATRPHGVRTKPGVPGEGVHA